MMPPEDGGSRKQAGIPSGTRSPSQDYAFKGPYLISAKARLRFKALCPAQSQRRV